MYKASTDICLGRAESYTVVYVAGGRYGEDAEVAAPTRFLMRSYELWFKLPGGDWVGEECNSPYNAELFVFDGEG